MSTFGSNPGPPRSERTALPGHLDHLAARLPPSGAALSVGRRYSWEAGGWEGLPSPGALHTKLQFEAFRPLFSRPVLIWAESGPS